MKIEVLVDEDDRKMFLSNYGGVGAAWDEALSLIMELCMTKITTPMRFHINLSK